VPAPAVALAGAALRNPPRARRVLLAILALLGLSVVLLIGVFGSMFGLQPLQCGYGPSRLAAAALPEALRAGGCALRDRPVGPGGDRRDRDEARHLDGAGCPCGRQRLWLLRGPDAVLPGRFTEHVGTATASTATAMVAGHRMTRTTRSRRPRATSTPLVRRRTTAGRSSPTTTPTGTSPRSSPRPTPTAAPPPGRPRAHPARRRASASCSPTRASSSRRASAPTCAPAASTRACSPRSRGSAGATPS
jgi:hypothetical protein